MRIRYQHAHIRTAQAVEQRGKLARRRRNASDSRTDPGKYRPDAEVDGQVDLGLGDDRGGGPLVVGSGLAAGVSVSCARGASLRIAQKVQCLANRSKMLFGLHRHQLRGKQFVPQFLVFFFVHGLERLAGAPVTLPPAESARARRK